MTHNQIIAELVALGGCYTKGLRIVGLERSADGDAHCIVSPNGCESRFGMALSGMPDEHRAQGKRLLDEYFHDAPARVTDEERQTWLVVAYQAMLRAGISESRARALIEHNLMEYGARWRVSAEDCAKAEALLGQSDKAAV